MRVTMIAAVLFFSTMVKAQTVLPGAFMRPVNDYSINRLIPLDDSLANRKWSFTKYTELSVGYQFFKGGSASVFSAPMGLQLNRKLNNNLYAFTGVSIAPSYINMRSSFLPGDLLKANAGNSFIKTNNFGMYSKAELGLTYINSEKTFSISGSIGVEKSSYPIYYNNNNAAQRNAVLPYIKN